MKKQQSLWYHRYHRYLDFHLFLLSHLDVVTRENAVPRSNLTGPRGMNCQPCTMLYTKQSKYSPPVVIAICLLENCNDVALLEGQVAWLIRIKVEHGHGLV
jgi:hypothetical protein